jgi:uncharacterized protein YjiS (DUF1127 family)
MSQVQSPKTNDPGVRSVEISAMTVAGRAVRSIAVGLAAALVRRWRAHAAKRRYLRDLATLRGLSDRDLQDIGVPRSGIDWAIRHGRDDPYAGLYGTVRACDMAAPVSIEPQTPRAPANAVAARKRAA